MTVSEMTEFTLVVKVHDSAAEAFRLGVLDPREPRAIGLAVEKAIGEKLADQFDGHWPEPYGEGLIEVTPGEGFA